MTNEEIAALHIVLDFVERWNKKDDSHESAEAAAILQRFYDKEVINWRNHQN